MEKILTSRDGTVYSAAEYIANVNNVDDHIKTLCEMILLVYSVIPEGKCVDCILSYNFLNALQEICRITGIEFDFNLDYTYHIDVGESKYREWVLNMIKDETRMICTKYGLVAPTNDIIDYKISNFSKVGILHLWMCNNGEEGMYHSE